MNNKQFLSLIDKINNFDQYYHMVENLTTKQKGDSFEIITYYVFKLSPVLNQNLTHIWLYQDIPQKIKDLLKLPSRDKGIDLLLAGFQ